MCYSARLWGSFHNVFVHQITPMYTLNIAQLYLLYTNEAEKKRACPSPTSYHLTHSIQYNNALRWKICKADSLRVSERRRHQIQEGRQTRGHWRNLKPLAPTATTLIRHGPTPGRLTWGWDCSMRCQQPMFFPLHQIISTPKSLNDQNKDTSEIESASRLMDLLSGECFPYSGHIWNEISPLFSIIMCWQKVGSNG